MKARMLGLVLCCAFSTVAQAEGLGVYINGGTTGFGLGLAGSISENMTGRLSFDTWKKTITQSNSDGNYKGDLKLQNVSLLGDWYPFAGAFRTTLGLVANGNKATLSATPNAGGTIHLTVNNIPRPCRLLSGEMKFNSTAPYLGIGWGNPVAKAQDLGLVATSVCYSRVLPKSPAR